MNAIGQLINTSFYPQLPEAAPEPTMSSRHGGNAKWQVQNDRDINDIYAMVSKTKTDCGMDGNVRT